MMKIVDIFRTKYGSTYSAKIVLDSEGFLKYDDPYDLSSRLHRSLFADVSPCDGPFQYDKIPNCEVILKLASLTPHQLCGLINMIAENRNEACMDPLQGGLDSVAYLAWWPKYISEGNDHPVWDQLFTIMVRPTEDFLSDDHGEDYEWDTLEACSHSYGATAIPTRVRRAMVQFTRLMTYKQIKRRMFSMWGEARQSVMAGGVYRDMIRLARISPPELPYDNCWPHTHKCIYGHIYIHAHQEYIRDQVLPHQTQDDAAPYQTPHLSTLDDCPQCYLVDGRSWTHPQVNPEYDHIFIKEGNYFATQWEKLYTTNGDDVMSFHNHQLNSEVNKCSNDGLQIYTLFLSQENNILHRTYYFAFRQQGYHAYVAQRIACQFLEFIDYKSVAMLCTTEGTHAIKVPKTVENSDSRQCVVSVSCMLYRYSDLTIHEYMSVPEYVNGIPIISSPPAESLNSFYYAWMDRKPVWLEDVYKSLDDVDVDYTWASQNDARNILSDKFRPHTKAYSMTLMDTSA